ncbi:diacylglycerol kinase [Chelatococcus sambhunathii]|uniref:Diacylglycerol kinase n=1 Tax=Chelatococcus sambhunathii TaxID=363953 RepID=A0ABU1DI32_9HYPH|nr:diacylglycerol kinase family protein [Chelatococcus sambhunathii]MDR4307749.1 diacylglycerol kinase [Chelatococcus sambhunathii]
MGRLGVVANARSWKNRDAAHDKPDLGDALYGAADGPDGYPALLRRFAEEGVTLVAVDGGDGTLRDVMSVLPWAYGGALPEIALLASGKTNVAAADVGGVARDQLPALAEAARAGAALKRQVRRPIQVEVGEARMLGFVFGLGAFERATRLVNERIHSRGFAQKMGVAMGVVMSGAAALGKDREVWRSGVPLAISIDGEEPQMRHSFALLATSLRRLMLGLWPFWGKGERGFDVTEIAAPPRRLIRTLATAGLGRPPAWAAAYGYRSAKADRVSLTLREPFIFDGDTFAPGADGRVELTSGPEFTFVRL